MGARRGWGWAVLAVGLGLSACAPPPPYLRGAGDAPPPSAILAVPGGPAVERWDAAGSPRAVVVAVHGVKGAAAVFARPAQTWSAHGLITYAWTQRLPDAEAMAADLRAVLRRVEGLHPGLPVFVVGESLGASLAVAALSGADAPPVDAVVLSAPAVWPDAVTAAAARGLLQAGAGVTRRPGFAYWEQVVALMDLARDRAADLRASRVLVLQGGQDEVVPLAGIEALVARLGSAAERRLLPEGGHTLFRDPGGDAVADQVADWLLPPDPGS